KMVTVAEETEQSLPDDDSTPSAYKRVEEAEAQWVATGGHLHQGLNIQAVADEMHLPRPLLTAWLKTTEWELFATWLNQLRIEEAKKVLREHRDWSNDYVAQHCGFSNRQYFHKKFKELTGLTPSEWQEGKGE
ncbi:MAG: helix-turn-helix transcriptional regulator, partial [Prevotella sp.]|nr:helix-turn-helix transcriptional regulator [Prevotella sp.]